VFRNKEKKMRRRDVLLLSSALVIGFTIQANGAPKKKPDSKKQPAKIGLTSEIVKAYITRKEKMLATNIGSSHKSVTLSFESVLFGKTRKTTQRDRITNGIEGPTVYPVRVKYVSHRVWGNGEKEAVKVHYDYEFYKDSYGKWDSYMVGPVNN
jgi:hypothetical protein